MTKLALTFTVLALVAALAGNLPATTHVTLTRPAIANGTALMAGDYRLLLGDGKVTFSIDKQSFVVPAKIETGSKRFEVNQVQYDSSVAPVKLTGIAIGGTNTRVIFN